MKKILPLVMAAALCLSGCVSSFHKDFSCPKTGFMEDASSAVFFAPQPKQKGGKKLKKAPPPTDVLVYTRLENLAGHCDLTRKKEAEVTFSFGVAAAKTDLAQGVESQNLSYFIAVLKPDESILQRENFYITVSFDNTGKGVASREHTVTIPLASPAEAAGYSVAIGLTLTPEQLAYNRAVHGLTKN